VEYQREGFDMFRAMMDGIKEEAVGYLFNLEVQLEEPEIDHTGHAHTLEEQGVEVGPALAQAAASSHDGEHPAIRAKGLEAPKRPQNLSYSAPSEDGEAAVVGSTATAEDDVFAGASRNAECPCGSGKKYKKCHGAPGGPTGLTTRVNG
jgi:preprotein translocase subunit SecA